MPVNLAQERPSGNESPLGKWPVWQYISAAMTRDESIWLEIAGGVRINPNGLTIRFTRASGPGGQNVNKLNTQAELWLEMSAIEGLTPAAHLRLARLAGGRLTDAGEIHLWSAAHRSQERNRQSVLEKLREMILKAMIEPKRRRPTRPTAGSRRRRLESKQHRSDLKAQRRNES
jgi:ribosome-associated protein